MLDNFRPVQFPMAKALTARMCAQYKEATKLLDYVLIFLGHKPSSLALRKEFSKKKQSIGLC